jgi:AcrR family transcriptional regulator
VTIVLAPSEKSARKAKGDGHLRRAEILSAAERIFIAQGYEGATIRKIADEVGVSSTALYMHFQDKDQILLEICDRAMSELLAINLRIATRPGDPVGRVRNMLGAYMRFALDNPNAYRLMFCAASMANSPRRRDATVQLGDRCFEKFSGVVGEIAAQGRLRTGDIRAVTQALWAACHGLISLRIAKPDFDWSPIETGMDVMLDGLLFGLVTD